jgi:segregation and condensation protein B
MSILSNIESILFVASKPLTTKKLAKAIGESVSHVEEALDTLLMKYNRDDSGIHILREADTVQMGTNAENSEAIDGFVKNEVTGELTKAQLETLTVIAYRSPITRTDLEQIRGVNCAVILRNLMMRGLVAQHDSDDEILPTYILTTNALSELGVRETSELSEYEMLSAHTNIERTLEEHTDIL